MPDWFLPVFVAVKLFAKTNELTAPLTHAPQRFFHDDGYKTLVVRHRYKGKQDTFLVGWPLSPQQMEAANKEWIDTEITALESN